MARQIFGRYDVRCAMGVAMRVISLTSVVILLAGALPARAADPLGRGFVTPTKTTEPAPANTEEQQKVDAIKAAYAAGKYDEAIAAATTLLRTAKDDEFKAAAARVVADSLRKKKDWKRARSAYVMLRDRLQKGSNQYVKYYAVAEILRASPNGVYGQTAVEDGEANPNPGPTLDDDTAMAEALSRLATTRAEKLKLRIALIEQARTAQYVIQRFLPLVVELRQIRVLWPEMPPELERVAAQTAAMRMTEISGQILAGLKTKQAIFETAKKRKRFSSRHKKGVLGCQSVCKDMAKAEESLAAGMDRLAGTAAWTEGEQLKADSASRRETFEQLVKEFVPPKPSGSGWGELDWIEQPW